MEEFKGGLILSSSTCVFDHCRLKYLSAILIPFFDWAIRADLTSLHKMPEPPLGNGDVSALS